MAVRFDAASENYTSTSGGITGTAATVLCWFRPVVDRNEYSGIWRLAGSGDAVQMALYLADDGSTIIAIDSAFTELEGPGTVVNTWYRAAVVMTGTTQTLYAGAFGAALQTFSATRNAISSPPRFGVGVPSEDEWFNGRVANVKLYEAALSLAECEAGLAQYAPHRSTNLRRHHPFLQAELTDHSGNGSTLSGGTGATTEDGPPIPWTVRPPGQQPTTRICAATR
jgi:hypothetical protein